MDPIKKSLIAEIQRRARARRKRYPFSIRPRRIQDLWEIIDSRHGGTIPDTPDGQMLLIIAAHHHAFTHENPERCLMEFLEDAAPWLSQEDIAHIRAKTLENPRRYLSSTLGKLLNLKAAERAKLKITSIGAIDETTAQRRKERDKQRKQKARQAKGCVTRIEYERKSISRQKPWESLGISRTTYYERKKSA